MKKLIVKFSITIALFAVMLSISAIFSVLNTETAKADEQVYRTQIFNTGIYLVGNRPAEEGMLGDYVKDEAAEEMYNILTPGWKIEGTANWRLTINKERDRGSQYLEIGNVSNIALLVRGGVHGECHIEKGVTADLIDLSATNHLTITGEGTINVFNQYPGPSIPGWICANWITVIGPTINIKKLSLFSRESIYGSVNVVKGTLNGWTIKDSPEDPSAVSYLNNDYGSNYLNYFTYINEGAEFFASGETYATNVGKTNDWDLRQFKGSSKFLLYDNKDQVNSPVHEIEVEGRNMNTLQIDGSTSWAKTIYAHPQPPKKHTVTFKYQDDFSTDLINNVAENDFVKQPDYLPREGYDFNGWYDNEECTGEQFNFDTPIKNNIILYASWTKNTPKPEVAKDTLPYKSGDVYITPIGNSGLRLVGATPAKTTDDFSYNEEKNKLVIYTTNWKLEGSAVKETEVNLHESSNYPYLELGNLNNISLNLHTTGFANIYIKENVVANLHKIAGNAGAHFIGKGVINIKSNQEALVLEQIICDGPTIIAESTCDKGLAAIKLDKPDTTCALMLNAGKLVGIMNCKNPDEENGYGLATDWGVFVDEGAELFLYGTSAAYCYADDSTLHVNRFVGDNKFVPYKQKKLISQEITESVVGRWYVPYIKNAATETIANTVYKAAKTYDKRNVVIKFQDGKTPDLVLSVDDGDVAKMPENPSREDFDFTGWFTKPVGTQQSVFDVSQEILTDKVVYANWKVREHPQPQPTPIDDKSSGANASNGAQTGDLNLWLIIGLIVLTAATIAATRKYYSKK